MSMRLSPIRRRKELMKRTFEDLLRSHRYVIVIDAYRLKASMLTEVRRLQDKLNFVIKGGKKGILLKAVEDVHPESLKSLMDKLEGQVLFIFTNSDPFEIAFELDKFEMDLEASPGDIAPIDIIIPEGNTGIPPGPVIGLFSSLNIPTKIVAGAIHIVKDTLVAKKGDKITPNLSNILSKLGIKPIKSKVNIVFAYDFKDNLLIEREYLIPNIEKLIEDLSVSAKSAYKIAMKIAYVTDKTLSILLSKAFMNALSLAIESVYIDEKTIRLLIMRAIISARRLEESVEYEH